MLIPTTFRPPCNSINVASITSPLRPKPSQHLPILRATPDDDDTTPIDIDALARRLSQEAEKLRRQQQEVSSSLDLGGQDLILGGPPPMQDDTASPASGFFGYEAKQAQADVLAEVGDGGFCVSEFELLTELGRISVQQLSSDGGMGGGRATQQQVVVIAFTARYTSGMPYEGPVVTFVKEYLPGAKAVACNELLVTKHLTDIPDHKWAAATKDLTDTPPVVPLLGYFLAGSSESALLAASVPGGAETSNRQQTSAASPVENTPDNTPDNMLASASPSPPFSSPSSSLPAAAQMVDQDTLWLVFKWERLLPLAAYPTARQNTPSYKGLLWLVAQPPDPVALRWGMLRRIARGMLRALCYCHERGVVHGSVGASSFLLSTFEDHKSDELVVKLTDFGFARMVVGGGGQEASPLYPSPVPAPTTSDDDNPLLLGQKQDMQAAAVVFVEMVCAALALDGPRANPMTAGAAQRLLFEVFDDNVDDFRQYCEAEPQLTETVCFMDANNGAGWDLLGSMVQGMPAAALLDHPFLLGEEQNSG